MDSPRRQNEMAGVRDFGVQKLRDLTIAVAVAAASGVAVIAWVSAATIPGVATVSANTGATITGDDGQPSFTTGNGFGQAPQPRTRGQGQGQGGSGIAVSGGSR
ncbi:MAG TPA: hypothetical protein VFD88_13260 [Clostridia bacterium]|nr:hypothetical protein [Clostridia bacterium]